MADVKRCDRCGAHFEKYPRCTLRDAAIHTYNFGPVYESFDLCMDCRSEFDEFMLGAKPKNLLERIKRMMCKEG